MYCLKCGWVVMVDLGVSLGCVCFVMLEILLLMIM